MVSNNLVTSGVLVPWLQFTLRGFIPGTTTDEALPFKLLVILALILALWLLLHLGWLWLLATLAVPLCIRFTTGRVAAALWLLAVAN